MNIYHSTQVWPYVYFGIHKITGEIYIGFREANKVPSDIDLYIYQTSSKVVHPIFDEFDWHIVAEFFTGDDAYDFEQNLILQYWDNPLLLNKNCRAGGVRFKSDLKGKPKSDSHKNKLKAAAKKRPPASDEAKKKMSLAKIGKAPNNKGKPNKKRDAVACANMSRAKSKENHPMWKKNHSDSAKEKISAAQKGKKKITTICPHCGKEGGQAPMARWHFEHCKYYPAKA